MAAAAILDFQKFEILTVDPLYEDFDEIWYSDAYWLITADLWLKFRIFENPKWRRPPSWKITKIAISP